MSKFQKSMEKIFDAQPIEISPTQSANTEIVDLTQQSEVPSRMDSDLDTDYTNSREVLQDLVRKGTEAIDQLMEIASESEHPRAYEVIANLINTTANVNEKLMNLQKVTREIKGIKNKTGDVKVDKAIFVGSTAELNKLIKGKQEPNE